MVREMGWTLDNNVGPEDMVVERVYLEKSKVGGAEGEKHWAKKVSDGQENGRGERGQSKVGAGWGGGVEEMGTRKVGGRQVFLMRLFPLP